jgi:hypothetical protein
MAAGIHLMRNNRISCRSEPALSIKLRRGDKTFEIRESRGGVWPLTAMSSVTHSSSRFFPVVRSARPWLLSGRPFGALDRSLLRQTVTKLSSSFRPTFLLRCFSLAAVLFSSCLPPLPAADNKTSREEAQFAILVYGREIGHEKFSISSSSDSASSSSVTEFRDPAKNQTVRIETQLNMGRGFLPKDYQRRTEVGGQKASLSARFAPGQAIFEYPVAGVPSKTGLLVGDKYVLLDENVFHHFIFLARLFDFNSKEKYQSFEVVIPQELDNGIVKINDAGKEKTSVRGKNKELHHLKLDSGVVQIDLWVDDHKIVHKIALPVKGIEVLRSS